MKIGVVVQRYGPEVVGGAELHARWIAQRLAQRHQVEVLTTCAVDYLTWENRYGEGLTRVGGPPVRRFRTPPPDLGGLRPALLQGPSLGAQRSRGAAGDGAASAGPANPGPQP